MRGSAPSPFQGTHHRRDRVGAHRVEEVAYGNEEVQHQGFVVAVSFELKRGERGCVTASRCPRGELPLHLPQPSTRSPPWVCTSPSPAKILINHIGQNHGVGFLTPLGLCYFERMALGTDRSPIE